MHKTKTKKNYENALSVLTSRDKFYINLGLERIGFLLELLGNPQDSLKCVHVAGTNGKGSTCAMLASILTEAGYKTGLYTSPHLIDYTERIKINGENIRKEDFAHLFFSILEIAEKNNIHVTEFEILTALAFVYFKNSNVDVVVLETGLGGRFDATNIIQKPVVTIITSIDIDHVDRLGDTIEKIAFEKAGIIKKKTPLITLYDNNGLDIIKTICYEKQSEIILANYKNYIQEKNTIITEENKFELPLIGLWQAKNLSLVLSAVSILNKNHFSICENAIKFGLKKVTWPGRMQFIKDKNLLLDGAHNFSAAKLLKSSLNTYFPNTKYIWIYSSINTKDYKSIIKVLFDKDDVVICTKSQSLASVDPEILKNEVLKYNPKQTVLTSKNIEEALTLRFCYKEKYKLTVVAGSLYTVGEVLKIIKS